MKTDWGHIGISDLAEIVSAALKKGGMDAVLVGGACVSIYTRNRYESSDLDYVTHTELKELAQIMDGIGFRRKSGRHFAREGCPLVVEFPPPPIAIGREMPITKFNRIKSLVLLSPTDCVKDRLAAYYSWNDPQALEQALMVARAQKVDMKQIERWSETEGAPEKFRRFKSLVKK